MYDQLADIRRRQIGLMGKMADIMGHVLKNVTEEQATTLRDGLEGWTILEILCHVRDFDTYFRERAQMTLNQDHPELPSYDHEQLAIDNKYNEQGLAYTYEGYVNSRRKTIGFFEALTDEQWERTGIHPERGHFTLTDAALQVSAHDADHLEQITRILEQEIPGSGSIPSETHT